MFDQPSCYVSGPLAAFLRITRFVGLAPIRFKKQGNGWRINLSTQLSKLGHFFMTVTWLAILATIFMEMNYKDLPSQRAWFRRIIMILEVIIMIITTGSMMHGAPRHMSRMITNLTRLQEINLKLNVLQWTSKLTLRHRLLVISWILFYFVLLGVDFATLITEMKLPKEYAWIKVTYALYYTYWLIIELGLIQFILIVLHIRSTFKIINDSLKRLLQEYADSTKPQRDSIHTEVTAYVLACEVVRDVNSSYGLMLLLLLASMFMHLVTTPYYFITDLLLSSRGALEMTYVNEIMQMCWCIVNPLNLILLIEPCHVSHNEMERTNELVGSLMVRPRSSYDPLAKELEQFFTHLGLNHVSYRPLNIVTLERDLVLAIVGSIVTYLVILIGLQ